MTNEHEDRAMVLLPCKDNGECFKGFDDTLHDDDCPASRRPAVAAALAEQAKEIERLNGELANAQDINGINNRAASERTQEVAALRERNERLDAKLTKLARHHENEVAAARVEGLRKGFKQAKMIIRTNEFLPHAINEINAKINELDAALERGKVCQTCGGSGAVDSGGVQPWGAAIYISCPDCALERGKRVSET